MPSEAQLTPMMAQYRRIKSELPRDALLLFRLGDFYELFFEDALAELQRLRPAEIIFPAESASLASLAQGGASGSDPSNKATAAQQPWICNGYDDWVFAPETALFTVRDHFKVASLDGFGLSERG